MCPSARTWSCLDCGAQWDGSEDERQCPECDSGQTEQLPCEDCPRVALDRAMSGPLGRRIVAAGEYLSAVNIGLTVTLDDIPASVFSAMLVLHSEQQKYEDERRENQRDGG